MKTEKKLFAGFLVVVMMFSVFSDYSGKTTVSAAEKVSIIAPANNKLVAAGYIGIEWNSVSDAKNYTLYINDTKVVTQKETSYEYYTTEVAYHTAYVKANFEDGTSITSSK